MDETEGQQPPIISSDSGSNSEYLDAEGDPEDTIIGYDANLERENDDQEQEQKMHSLVTEIREQINAAGAAHRTTEGTSGTTVTKKTTLNGAIETAPTSSATSPRNAKQEEAVSGACGIEVDGTNSAEEEDEFDYLHDSTWRNQRKHIFILSEAGKPIYSLHGKEEKLATLFGIIQALVSFVQHGQDAITSIHARGIKFVFLERNSLILVAASRTNMSVGQIQAQLSDVYNQILFTLTYSLISKIFGISKNFDLRHSLAGSERLINHILINDSNNKKISNNIFTALTNSIRVLPLPAAMRSTIASAIQSNCSKIKKLVFAILIADNKLISLVRMKTCAIHPSDLRLVFNLIECSESFKRSENWTPICLPKFAKDGYLYAHVSYLAVDCQACLLLLSVEHDAFDVLSDAKQRITEKLRRAHCLDAINEEINKRTFGKLNLTAIGVPEIRHFIYKPKAIAQVLCSDLVAPYTTLTEFECLEAIYCDLLQRVHNSTRPLKLIYAVKGREVVLAWVTAAYELYAVFEPILDKATVIKHVDKLIKWVEKEHDIYFIRSHPTF